MRFLFGLIVVLVLIIGCKHKTNFDSLAEVNYKTDIEPIISGNCTFSGCHGLVEKERFSLLSYDDLIKHTNIVAGSPEKSELYQIINTFNLNNRMPPKPYNQLSDIQIQLIYVWIGQGAKNN
jgi:hypothetical protein